MQIATTAKTYLHAYTSFDMILSSNLCVYSSLRGKSATVCDLCQQLNMSNMLNSNISAFLCDMTNERVLFFSCEYPIVADHHHKNLWQNGNEGPFSLDLDSAKHVKKKKNAYEMWEEVEAVWPSQPLKCIKKQNNNNCNDFVVTLKNVINGSVTDSKV